MIGREISILSLIRLIPRFEKPFSGFYHQPVTTCLCTSDVFIYPFLFTSPIFLSTVFLQAYHAFRGDLLPSVLLPQRSLGSIGSIGSSSLEYTPKWHFSPDGVAADTPDQHGKWQVKVLRLIYFSVPGVSNVWLMGWNAGRGTAS